MKSFTSTESQVWALDLIIAIVIFLGAIFLFYKYSVNLSTIGQDNIPNLLSDAKVISSYLVSEGIPNEWTILNVTIPGLMKKNLKLSTEKWTNFYQLAESDYQRTRNLVSTRHDYFIFFEKKNGEKQIINGAWWAGKNYSMDNPKDIIKIYRFVYYNSTILRMGLYVW